MSLKDMSNEEFIRRLYSVFEQNGLGGMLTEQRAESFLRLTEIMLEENEKYNLTAITEPDKIILNHYADCAALAAKMPEGASVCDIGCGAGFPTLPMAIVRPDLKILGVDATAKRTAYVEAVAKALSLGNVSVLTARAEEMGQAPAYRERFDRVTARAVANMRVLSELCLPLCRVGGEFVAMKGKNAEAELAEAMAGIPRLCGRLACIESITLRSGEEELTHPLIVIEKVGKCPKEYPRMYSKILKKPL